jgi:hypothetical protein
MSRRLGKVIKGPVSGFVAGLIASWVMNQFQETLSQVREGCQKPHGRSLCKSRNWVVGHQELLFRLHRFSLSQHNHPTSKYPYVTIDI